MRDLTPPRSCPPSLSLDPSLSLQVDSRKAGQDPPYAGCHQLKHEPGAAQALLREMQQLPTAGLNTTQREKLQSAITYFDNHHHQMDYAGALKKHGPIGSGVTEAACKTLVKQRLCRSGMRCIEVALVRRSG